MKTHARRTRTRTRKGLCQSLPFGRAGLRQGGYDAKTPTWNTATGAVSAWVTNLATLAGQSSTNIGNLCLARNPETNAFDADGNLLQDRRWDYTWNGENRLVKMTSRSGAPADSRLSLEFRHDWQGRRARKTVSRWDTDHWSLLTDHSFLYDGWNLLAEVNPTNNTMIRAYAWGLDASGTMQGAGGVGGLLWMTGASPVKSQVTTNFASYDGNHNVMALVNAADKSVSASYEYGPFGELMRATGPLAKANPFQFSTKFQDDESGLVYYGYRYYAPSEGRWLSRDPSEEKSGFNLHGFVANVPVSSMDFLGLWNSRVHYSKSVEWAGNAGFGPTYAGLIGESDDGVDSTAATSPFPWGEMSRHLNQPGEMGGDSRIAWYNSEFQTAKSALKDGDRYQDRTHCVRAAQAFGSGLHSWQDVSAHRSWPIGGTGWGSGIAHPEWWDDWYGEVNSGYPLSDVWWARYYRARPIDDDYNEWTGSGTQIASQEAARIQVTSDSEDALKSFVEEVRKHCFCSKDMLLEL